MELLRLRWRLDQRELRASRPHRGVSAAQPLGSPLGDAARCERAERDLGVRERRLEVRLRAVDRLDVALDRVPAIVAPAAPRDGHCRHEQDEDETGHYRNSWTTDVLPSPGGKMSFTSPRPARSTTFCARPEGEPGCVSGRARRAP